MKRNSNNDAEQLDSPAQDGPVRVGESSVPQSADLIYAIQTKVDDLCSDLSLLARKLVAKDQLEDAMRVRNEILGVLVCFNLVRDCIDQKMQSLVPDDQARPAD